MLVLGSVTYLLKGWQFWWCTFCQGNMLVATWLIMRLSRARWVTRRQRLQNWSPLGRWMLDECRHFKLKWLLISRFTNQDFCEIWILYIIYVCTCIYIYIVKQEIPNVNSSLDWSWGGKSSRNPPCFLDDSGAFWLGKYDIHGKVHVVFN